MASIPVEVCAPSLIERRPSELLKSPSLSHCDIVYTAKRGVFRNILSEASTMSLRNDKGIIFLLRAVMSPQKAHTLMS